MISKITLKRFTKLDLRKDVELLNKFSSITHQEFVASDYPLPVPSVDWFRNFWLLDPFPFAEENYILVEIEKQCIGYGIERSNEKFSPELAYLFVYLLPEYRGQKLLWSIVEQLTKSIPIRIKKFFLSIRADKNAPNYDYRKRMVERVQSEFGEITFKARRSTTDLRKFSKEEVMKKAEALKKIQFAVVLETS